MEKNNRSRTQRTSGAMRATRLSLPTRLVCDVVRLAELMGTPYQVELAVNLATALERHGDPEVVRETKAIAKAISSQDAPWERVSLWLPGWQAELVRELAGKLRVSQSKALAALLAPVIDEHLTVATYALERGVSFLKAHQALNPPGANPLPAAPVKAGAAKRRTARKRSA